MSTVEACGDQLGDCGGQWGAEEAWESRGKPGEAGGRQGMPFKPEKAAEELWRPVGAVGVPDQWSVPIEK